MTTMYETSDLPKRVERYEAAVEELRAAHQDIRTVLVDQLLYERWQQIGADLGFTADRRAADSADAFGLDPFGSDLHGDRSAPPNLAPHPASGLSQQIPQMSESWAG